MAQTPRCGVCDVPKGQGQRLDCSLTGLRLRRIADVKKQRLRQPTEPGAAHRLCSQSQRAASPLLGVFGVVRLFENKAGSNRSSDPSLVPLRLMKTPAAGHPDPQGRGRLIQGPRPPPICQPQMAYSKLPAALCLLPAFLLLGSFQLRPVERPSFVSGGTAPHDAGWDISLFIRAI